MSLDLTPLESEDARVELNHCTIKFSAQLRGYQQKSVPLFVTPFDDENVEVTISQLCISGATAQIPITYCVSMFPNATATWTTTSFRVPQCGTGRAKFMLTGCRCLSVSPVEKEAPQTFMFHKGDIPTVYFSFENLTAVGGGSIVYIISFNMAIRKL